MQNDCTVSLHSDWQHLEQIGRYRSSWNLEEILHPSTRKKSIARFIDRSQCLYSDRLN